MSYSKLMKERIRRVTVLFKELGYELFDEESQDGSYSCGFASGSGFQGAFFIVREQKFLEMAFNFTFSPEFDPFIRERLPELLEICFEYGCYTNMFTDDNAISISIFSKIYYSGLNYAGLRDTLADFRACVEAVKELVTLKHSS